MHFTPTERKILELMSDFRPHSKKKLHECLVDDMGAHSNVAFHLTNLNNKLAQLGEEIVSIRSTHNGMSYCRMRVSKASE